MRGLSEFPPRARAKARSLSQRDPHPLFSGLPLPGKSLSDFSWPRRRGQEKPLPHLQRRRLAGAARFRWLASRGSDPTGRTLGAAS